MRQSDTELLAEHTAWAAKRILETATNPEDLIPHLIQTNIAQTQAVRYRIQVAHGMKGGVSWEATVDAEGLSMEEVLARSDQLRQELEARYPAQTGG